ncbi:MAG: sulfatase-like hydrolase/transferase, partial [Verrucomicrobiota bacterium]
MMNLFPVSLCLLVTLASTSLAQASPPNILFFLADDLGSGDIACYGAPDVHSPHLDRLAAEGVRFLHAYANGPECTPSRTGILTGRYPQRVGGLECAIGTGNVGRYDHAILLAEKKELGLPPEEARLAPILKKRGYRNGVFGKWHLGYEAHFHPFRQGFDAFTGFLGGNVEYFRHFELSPLPVYLEGETPVERDGYLTHLITEDALTFLENHHQNASDAPFFLFVTHAAPHFPFQAPGDETKPVPTAENWTQGDRSTYAAMIEDMDQDIGKLLAKIEEQGLTQNTLVIFASDHGAMLPGSNAPWRDFKGTLFEGGIRVPLL